MRIIAVDWSGRAKASAEALWRAEVRNGKLIDLRNGLGRGELIAKLSPWSGTDQSNVPSGPAM